MHKIYIYTIKMTIAMRLSASVSAINDNISSGRVCASIANQIHVGSLQLLCITRAAHGHHRVPQFLRLLVDEVGQTSADVTGGDGVDAGKVAPFVGERASHVDAAGLGNVVGGLLLGEVGNVAGHRSGNDEGTMTLLLEVRADGLGAVGSAVQVDLDDLVPSLFGRLDDAAVSRGAGIGDEAVDVTKVLQNFADKLFTVVVVGYIAFVGLNLDSVGLDQLGHVLLSSLFARRVAEGEVSTHLGATPGGLDTHAAGTGGACDDDDLALQAEEVKQAAGLGDLLRHIGKFGVVLVSGMFQQGTVKTKEFSLEILKKLETME